ncbi:class I histocompatibility antigen, F10 alpha chain-like [Hoplias malabaricus]|uniref:class I histocompatibility antigen, F10 alpha chain-like n=1 Tax=Hoplias malabaricus TaxID=27720 RepID=UPI003461A9A7
MRKMKEVYALFYVFHLLQQSSGDVHSYSVNFIGSQGLDLPDYMERITVDDVTVFYYDSSMKGEVPCPEWLNSTADRQHWEDINLLALSNRYRVASALPSVIKQFNQTGFSSKVSIFQVYSRCDLYPDGTRKAVFIHAFNGRDFLAYDIERKTITAAVPEAAINKQQREEDWVRLEFVVSFYRTTCYERLNMFLQNVPQLKMKKVPEVYLLERSRSGSTVLTCHVTGFYPREVQVEWIGPGLQSVDEEIGRVLPNGDGTYQTRRSVIRPEENPEKHSYSCVVYHSSVPTNITRTLGLEVHTWLWVGIPLTGTVLFIIIGTVILIKRFIKRKETGT